MADIQGDAIQAAAEALLRQYQSEYSAPHLTWRDFADQAREILQASVPVLAESVKVPDGERMSIGFLREALTTFTDLNGAWSCNLHESKELLLRVHGQVFTLKQVAASFHEGSFVIMLDGETRA